MPQIETECVRDTLKFKEGPMKKLKFVPMILCGVILIACETTPEPVEIVEVVVPPLKTCTEISALTRVDIPAETQTFIAITEIENPPYEPIQRKEEQVRVIKEAETIFVDSEGLQVTDICETEIDPGADDALGQNPGT